MGILEKLQSLGSALGLGGNVPEPLNHDDPHTINKYLEGSTLDLDGVTPEKYSDTAPENQGGRV
jgi:hypothetical protein|tara:strand:+ start:338 stop:529 length:192 start_codon:yes stop_codon:yes gene_type:complete